MSNITAATDITGVFSATNDLLSDWPSRLFLIGIWILIVLLITISTFEVLKGMVAASFVTAILAFLMYANDLTSSTEPLIALGILVISALILYLGGVKE